VREAELDREEHRGGERSQLERLRIGHRDLCTPDALRRGVEVVEARAADSSGELGADPERRPTLLGDEHPVRLAHRFDHRVDVERAQRAQVDDLGLEAALGQAVGDGQRILVYALSFGLGLGLCNLLGPRMRLSLVPLAGAALFAARTTATSTSRTEKTESSPLD